MSPKDAGPLLPFGATLGHAPGGVEAFSSDYASVDRKKMPDRSAFRNYIDGVYTGYKWQCVEFARRWLLLNKGYVFDDIAMAYDIFRLDHVTVVASGKKLPIYSFRNGAPRRPEPGAMLIWAEGGEFEMTGHVAIVTEVDDHYVRVAEQNVRHAEWPEGRDYSRELPAEVGEDGGYWISCSFRDGEILGWVLRTDDPAHAEVFPPEDPRLFRVLPRRATGMSKRSPRWLNIANPDEAAFARAMEGHRLTDLARDASRYILISETAEAELRRATNEMHAMFLHATDWVMRDDARLEPFNIPSVLWPRIHQSWNNRRNQTITGRFDFAMTEDGLKVYEYNCDSASCHLECGKAQGSWSRHYGVPGDDPGAHLWHRLVEGWKRSEAKGLVHVLIDEDDEELYHALFMKSAMEAAGLEPKLIVRLEGLQFDAKGKVRDADGAPINWVWKTWAWETALDQLRAEADADAQAAALKLARTQTPRLMDVLFQPHTMVFEPLWSLIPSNKAILTVLWEMFPENRYLLETTDKLTPRLRAKGYARKPIAGRCGQNIAIVGPGAEVLEETDGRFDDQDCVYQELAPLPVADRMHVQLCTFTVEGTYAGACTRADRSPIITKDSDLLPLRVLDDTEFRRRLR